MRRLIELEETNLGDKKVYKVKGCKTLIFDEWGFENLTEPYPDSKNLHKAKEFFNGKFVALSSPDDCFVTVGKIYEVKDGRFENDDGYDMPLNFRAESLSDIETDMNQLVHPMYGSSPIRILQIKE